jgi:hypothetical protein
MADGVDDGLGSIEDIEDVQLLVDVLLLAGLHQTAVGLNQVGFQQIVDAKTVRARQVALSTA